MPRPLRRDGKGRWHHSYNRSVAQRPIFEDRRDIRFFLSRVAWMVREGWIEVHAYIVMANHFHLLVRSPIGELSAALHWIQRQYAGYFNRTRNRDGPAFRGRFRSREIRSPVYWDATVHYIDHNPVAAGLVVDSMLYPWGSACFHAGRPGAPWLDRRLVKAILGSAAGDPCGGSRNYQDVYGSLKKPFYLRLVEDRMKAGGNGPDPLDDLVGASPPATRKWLTERARNADGAARARLIVSAETVQGLVTQLPAAEEATARSQRLALSAGLYRTVCGLSTVEAGRRVGRSPGAVCALVAEHNRLVLECADYGDLVARLLRESLAIDIGRPAGEEILLREFEPAAEPVVAGDDCTV